MSTFLLPDLGEGLPEAEIVTWHVKEGDTIKTDDPMVSVETAKAIVDVPSPQNGVIKKLFADEGGIVKTGAPLVEFESDAKDKLEKAASDIVAQDDQDNDSVTVVTLNDIDAELDAMANQPALSPSSIDPADHEDADELLEDAEVLTKQDSGTVVGNMPTSNVVVQDDAIIRKNKKNTRKKRPKATPAVRQLARELGVELTEVPATGKQGQITPNDVRSFAEGLPSHEPTRLPQPAPFTETQTLKPNTEGTPLRGPARSMAKAMSLSRDQVAACSLFDDADIQDWAGGQDITVRIIRAIVAGVKAEPKMNAWLNQDASELSVQPHIDLALAVDTDDGLIVPVMRHIEAADNHTLREELNTLKQKTRERTVTPQDMLHPTITLSNFGMMAGRYATPVVVPPQVAIVGVGGARHDVVAVMGGVEVHKRIPLSITFDHRAITGGQACRFFAAMIEDLQKAS